MTQTRHSNSDGTERYTNHLVNETSPYLLHHAHDPVEWYPWGREALERAQREMKPIHLSVGYNACHWCHIKQQESFQDEATAKILNDNFINIKVDREERPDIDRIYQIAQQMLTQRGGGWPLTMFLTHDDRPDVRGGRIFQQMVDGIAAEDLDPLALHDFGNRFANLHLDCSPIGRCIAG